MPQNNPEPYTIAPAQPYGTLHTETTVEEAQEGNDSRTPVVVKRTYFDMPGADHIVGDTLILHSIKEPDDAPE